MPFCSNCGEVTTGPRCGKCNTIANEGYADTFAADGNAPVHTQWTDRYVSSALGTDMNDGLRRMADVKPEWIDKNCAQCKKQCTEGAFEGPSGVFRGKPLCEDCYARNFSKGECVKCHKFVIEGQYVQADGGKIWHQECFSDEHRCAVCRQPIFGEVVNAVGKDYHPNCFQCGKCQKPLTNSFVDFRGAAYCKSCADEAKTNKVTSTPVKTEEVLARERNNAAAVERQGQLQDLKQFKHIGLNDTCKKCGEEMLTNGITVGNAIYHEECMVCTKCSKPFDDGKYSVLNGSPYHSACAKTVGSGSCPACSKPITGKTLEYGGNKMHADCFNCSSCKKNLAGQAFAEDGGKPYCESCIKQRARGPTGIHTGTYQPGFTVNPVTGEKEQRGYGGAKIGTPVQGLGTKDTCPKCSKPVYFQDKAPGPSLTIWHRDCLVCVSCKKWLDSNANVREGNKLYCRDCIRKL